MCRTFCVSLKHDTGGLAAGTALLGGSHNVGVVHLHCHSWCFTRFAATVALLLPELFLALLCCCSLVLDDLLSSLLTLYANYCN